MRIDFFGTEPDRSELEQQIGDQDPSLRWAAAVELSELRELWALELLWQLRRDPDEHVRSVAERGVAQAPTEMLSKLTAEVNREFDDIADQQPDQASATGLFPFSPWKTRPVDPPGSQNEWTASVVVTDIIATEGPVTGARLLRLYGEAAFPDSPRKIKRNWVERAVSSLIQRSRISKLGDSSGSPAFEDWTLQRTGSNPIVARERGARRISEIPVVEIQRALEQEHGRRATNLSRDRKFSEILRIYGIAQNEYHLVGAALEKEWLELLG